MAQTASRGEFRTVSIRSEALSNTDTQPKVVFLELIQTPDALWTRVYFAELQLEGGSHVRLTALADGEVQDLDAESARTWGNSSAYFNGGAVLVELEAAPRTTANHLAIDRIAVETTEAAAAASASDSACGMCGTDDRIPSNVTWAGRLMPAGCSASIYNTCSCLVSAGHCMSGGMVIQFKVPNSLSNCGLVNPPVAEQFPITSYQYLAVDVGSDWAVLKTGNNSLGQKPFDRYGTMQPIATAPPATGNSVGLWGYGVDTQCTYNQVQQYSGGPVSVIGSSYFLFSADVAVGSSGTGIVRNGQLIGVATNCTEGCPNVATSINVPAFAAARANLCSCTGVFLPCSADITGDSRVNNDDLVTVLNHWGMCPSPPTPCLGDIVTLPFNSYVNMEDLLAVLSSWGDCP